MATVTLNWFDGWWGRHLALQISADVTAELRGPGIYWHRVGPREHVVHIVRSK